MKITRIRIPARFQVDDRSQERIEQADFKLGVGPCGKEVTKIAADQNVPGYFCVSQTHRDGSIKAFLYPVATLTGRVELEYGILGDDI